MSTMEEISSPAGKTPAESSSSSSDQHPVARIISGTLRRNVLLTTAVAASVAGAVIVGLLPPLVLERIIDQLTAGNGLRFSLGITYFALLALAGGLEAARESLLTVLGQKITHALRSALGDKLGRLPADSLARQDPGATASRFVGDVDTVEDLFTSGIISMFADACQMMSIFVILFLKNRGLALLLLGVLPLVALFTRHVQKRMLKSQIDNRVAVARASNFVPETIRNIRTIHGLGAERFMREHYDQAIEESYRAVSHTNFYDAVYSPVILITNAVIVAIVYMLSASGNAQICTFFGMSVGTSVAVVNYISQIFGPIESIGMEIQTIQSALAGVHRIGEFLNLPERWEAPEHVQVPETGAAASKPKDSPACIEFRDVTFGYDADAPVLRHLSLAVHAGEQVTVTGRTGAGKSTMFKLILGLYRPQSGNVLIYGTEASRIPDRDKRPLFGYVEQRFRMVPGTVRDQITLFDPKITEEQVQKAAETVLLTGTINHLEHGLDTPCTKDIFSQGQWQLLSIARAIAAEPPILLLDEITANLDADTEKTVLSALKRASAGRTVLSISHRLYEDMGGREIKIGSADLRY